MNHSSASGSGHRPLLSVLLAATALGLAAAAATAQTCASGGTSALPPPAVDHLRGYRASFRSPTRLAVDSLGRIYVADPARGTVVVRAADGHILSADENLGHPVSIAVEADGNRIYLGDDRDGRVTAYGANWLRLFDFGQGIGELAFPADLAIDPQTGHVWVTDGFSHRVEVYGSDGTKRFGFGGEGSAAGQFRYPTGIFVDGVHDEVLVVDQVNGRVQIFDRDGNFKSCIGRKGSGGGRFNLPQGIWADGLGRIYVVDAFEGWIQVVDRQGAAVAFLAAAGRGPGQLATPADLVIDPSGRLLVSASSSARLEMFGLDGYSDPEHFVPAEVVFHPDALDPRSATATVVIAVPGYRLELLDLDSITANGIAAIPGSAAIGDLDGDHEPDAAAAFDAAALAATLAPDGGVVHLSGQLADLEIEGFARVSIVAVPGGDGDGDGISDADDLCPGTEAGGAVDLDGCSLDQLCPCAGPAPGIEWRNHGQYVSCVATHVDVLSPPLDPQTRRLLIAQAAKSDCGRNGS